MKIMSAAHTLTIPTDDFDFNEGDRVQFSGIVENGAINLSVVQVEAPPEAAKNTSWLRLMEEWPTLVGSFDESAYTDDPRAQYILNR